MQHIHIGCADECGARVVDEQAAEQAGWHWLSIRSGWRCGACARSLAQAAGIKGTTGEVFIDRLPPISIGALRRETASSIHPPVVRP